METKNKLLEVKDLSIHYFTDEGVVRAVNNIDFEPVSYTHLTLPTKLEV